MATSNDPKKPASEDVKQMLTDLSVKLIKAEAKRLTDEMPSTPTPAKSKHLAEQSNNSNAKQLFLTLFVVAAVAAWGLILWKEPARPTPMRAHPIATQSTTCTKSVTSEVKDAAGHVVTTKTETQTGPCQASNNDNAAVEVGGHLAKWTILSLF